MVKGKDKKKSAEKKPASISITKEGVKIKTDVLEYEGDGSLVRAAVDIGTTVLETVAPKKQEPKRRVIVAGKGESDGDA